MASPPTISGTVQVGQTLTGSPGMWSGTTPMTYTYQWQRCDTSGGACAASSGATGATYLLGSGDVGYTIRLSVTATNSAGSTTASSAATAVLASVATAQPYYFEHFNGAFNTGIMRVSGASGSSQGLFFVANGASGGGAKLVDCTASSPGTCQDGTQVNSISSYGQATFVGTECNYVHAGWASGTCGNGYGKHEETWTHFRVMFPSSGFMPVPRQQDTFWEMHIDQTTEHQNAYIGSNLLKIAADDNGTFSTTCAGSPYFCTKAGLNPRIALQLCGGNLATVTSTSQACTTYQMPSNSLIYDHWYNIVIDMNYNDDPTVGGAKVWIDGVKQFDVRRATQYRRADGTLSYNGSPGGFYNYRYWASFLSGISFDEWEWGPTAASVGFNAT